MMKGVLYVIPDSVRKTVAGTGTSTSGGAPSENVNMRQAKLEAAASAASVYGRSFAYPPASTLNRYILLE
jgi:E3 ubiquitin-protein ligase synoviolin